ncbi:MAG TPA: MarR family transcriptional regulator [Selenomonadales bacterium]|nr:MarR family transcriptional regulator [Selenomonadales bacterium]
MQLRRLERSPRSFGAAGPLTPGEIHTIAAIGCKEGILMGELAARLGVTKGAATQMASRLEVKGFVRRAPDPADARATVISLTQTGLLAYQAHEELHRRFCQKISACLSSHESEIFVDCLDKLCEALEE